MTDKFDLQLFADTAGVNAPSQSLPFVRGGVTEGDGEVESADNTKRSTERGPSTSSSDTQRVNEGTGDADCRDNAAALSRNDSGKGFLAGTNAAEATDSASRSDGGTPLAAHLDSLLREAEEFKRTVPDFDLWQELDNPDFARLTNPTTRVSIRAAYYAVHHDEINARNMRAAAEAAAAETAKSLTRAYLSASRRPQENGSAASAASVESVDWRTASREQLIAQRRAILAAAAKGEKLYPKG